MRGRGRRTAGVSGAGAARGCTRRPAADGGGGSRWGRQRRRRGIPRRSGNCSYSNKTVFWLLPAGHPSAHVADNEWSQRTHTEAAADPRHAAGEAASPTPPKRRECAGMAGVCCSHCLVYASFDPDCCQRNGHLGGLLVATRGRGAGPPPPRWDPMPATWHDMFRAAAAAAAGADTVLLQLLRERHGAAAAAAADTVLWRLLRERWRTWRDDVPGGGGGWRRCGGAGVGTGGACGRRMRAAARRRGIRQVPGLGAVGAVGGCCGWGDQDKSPGCMQGVRRGPEGWGPGDCSCAHVIWHSALPGTLASVST